MCGIFGYTQLNNDVEKMVPMLALFMTTRGKDSWGATNGVEEVKKIGELPNSWKFPRWEHGIFHTRSATAGLVSIENQHPFTFKVEDAEDAYIKGVHNGVITNHTKLKEKYQRDFAVDSMHVYAHIAKGLVLKEIEGWGVLAWYEVENSQTTMNFCRFNSNNFSIASLESGPIVFASTKEAIVLASQMAEVKIEKYYAFEAEHRHSVVLDNDPQKLWINEAMTFGVKGTWNKYQAAVSQVICHLDDDGFVNRRHYSPQIIVNDKTYSDRATGKFCMKCGRSTEKKSVLCKKCWEDFKASEAQIVVKELANYA